MKVHTPIVYPSPSIHIAGTVSEKKVWSVNYVMDIPSISISGVTVSIDRSEETRVDNNDD
jgi:hypothetical protein